MRATLCARLALLAALVPLDGCAIASLSAESDPARLDLDSDGLINGHLAFGFRDENRLLDARVLENDALAELVLWRLARVEVGLLHLAVGVGPIDLGLGVLGSDPELPEFLEFDEPEPEPECWHAPPVHVEPRTAPPAPAPLPAKPSPRSLREATGGEV